MASADEPNAFRISPPSLDAVTPPSKFIASQANASSVPEPPSWFPISELSSPTFDAHAFLQRATSHRFETMSARLSHIPLLDHSFNADAALAALDMVDSALRRQRDASRREEHLARDELRKSLHLSARKKDQLMAIADNVTAHIATFGDVGRQAATALDADLASLAEQSEELARLEEARDMVTLFTQDATELDAIHVSRLLAKARKLLRDGSVQDTLPTQDIIDARQEVSRCEAELAESLFEWMRQATDSRNTSVVRDCATAAENLDIQMEFVHEFVNHVFSFESDQLSKSMASAIANPIDSLNDAYWEAVNAVKDVIPTILESFSSPSKPLAILLQMLAEKKIVVVASNILKKLRTNIREKEHLLDGIKADDLSWQSPENTTREDEPPLDRVRAHFNSEGRDNWREGTRRISAEKHKYLTTCCDTFKALAKLKLELLSLCRVPGAEQVDAMYSSLRDPYASFADQHLPYYLKTEKTWIDDQLGAAFVEITRIELHTPRLAPRDHSEAEVYHRYRAFYSHIASNFKQMTVKAIESTYESLSRSVSVLGSIQFGPDMNLSSSNIGNMRTKGNGGTNIQLNDDEDFEIPQKSISLHSQSWVAANVEKEAVSTEYGPSSNFLASGKEVQSFFREVLDSLVMSYLGNAETILQAATHVLPTCVEDAQMPELWISGASPLTAYLHAVEVLSKSNEILDEFLLTLEPCDKIEGISAQAETVEKMVKQFVPSETRDVLHGSLTSGLSDLGVEAQIGVRAAVESLKARLFAMLSTPAAKEAYTKDKVEYLESTQHFLNASSSSAGLELEPTAIFISASSFIEQQLQSVTATGIGANRDFVISELSSITRTAVLQCWCSCRGTISIKGALQLIADGRAIAKVFQNHSSAAEVVQCLPALGQLFLGTADGLWSCVESKALGTVDARTVVSLLRKRCDYMSERVVKVCQSLGATFEELDKTS